MAENEMFDSLSVAVADYTATTLSVSPTSLDEKIYGNDEVLTGENGAEQIIVGALGSIWICRLTWNNISKSDAGTVLNFYADVNKGRRITRYFQWAHPVDGHFYVARFNSPLSRVWATYPNNMTVAQCELRVKGYYTP